MENYKPTKYYMTPPWLAYWLYTTAKTASHGDEGRKVISKTLQILCSIDTLVLGRGGGGEKRRGAGEGAWVP